MMKYLLILLGFLLSTNAFHTNPSNHIRPIRTFGLSASSSTSKTETTPAVPTNKVKILKDAEAVGSEIRSIISQAATEAIAQKGSFALAIPGGSILKMLAGPIPNKEEWTSKTMLVYVNHKCVKMDDGELATHAKASKLFLDSWEGVNAIIMDGTDDGQAEAASYENKIRQISDDVLPKCQETGLPIFDLSLIGVGDDGHIGSLYPNREEVLVDSNWVLPVAMKDPPSITLSLPLMKASKQVVVAACGVSDKYPKGKSEGMRRAIVEEQESLTSFPAVGLRDCALWVMDEAAASALGEEYNSQAE